MKTKPAWETALDKFLLKWKDKKEVTGALVCGSYITGSPSPHSDIDVQLILDPAVSWRERGNEVIDGFLIEYFANPPSQHVLYAADDDKARRRVNAHMFATGRILFDKTGDLARLVKDARRDIKKVFPRLDNAGIEAAKYHLWDLRDNLEEVYEADSPAFYLACYGALEELFQTYAGYLRYDRLPAHKLHKILTTAAERDKYRVPEFFDPPFLKIFLPALDLKNKSVMIKEFRQLTDYVLHKMGGFEINGWRLRTTVEKRGSHGKK